MHVASAPSLDWSKSRDFSSIKLLAIKPNTGTFYKVAACCCMPDRRCSALLAATKGTRKQQSMQHMQPKHMSPINLSSAIASNIFRYSVFPKYSVPRVPWELYNSENMITEPQILNTRPYNSNRMSTHLVHERFLVERQHNFQIVCRTTATIELMLRYIQRSWSGCYFFVISASSLLAIIRDPKIINTRASQQRFWPAWDFNC